MDIISSILPIIYLILIAIFIKKALTASFGKGKISKSSRESIFDTKPRKIPKTSSMPQNKDTSYGGSFIDSERKKERKKPFNIFGRLRDGQDVDCDLDERIFGPKGQHKDLF